MSKLMDLFKNEVYTPFSKKITAYGWKFNYDVTINSGISKYLFCELEIKENIAPSTNTNRDGRLKKNYYITVHDTGDTDQTHDAMFWSNVVKVQEWEQGRYEASYQYVCDDKTIYHNIPDDEIAYHAGDSTIQSFEKIDTNVCGDNEKPIIDISSDGYYTIDNKKTNILAPKKDDLILDKTYFVTE